MINRLCIFTRAAASGAVATSFACAYHCFHYTNECSLAERAAMQSVAVYDSHSEELENIVRHYKASGDKRLAMEILAARSRSTSS